MKFLEINKDALGREGEKQKSLAEAKMKDLQAVKEDGAVVTKMIIGASPYAPPSVISQAKSLQARGKSPVEVAIALGKYGGDFMGDLVKRSTIAKKNINIV